MMTTKVPAEIPIANPELFEIAMKHSSATTKPVEESYERLEFFGDAVLGLIIAEYLYEQYKDWDQGMMSKARSSIVQEGPLAETALRLGLDKHLYLGPGEEASNGRLRPSILADVFEAVIGAIYLESGFEKSRWFVLEQLHPYLRKLTKSEIGSQDHKSRLQELTQSIWQEVPQYKAAHESGSAADQRFEVQVLLSGEILGEGTGRSKKEAEQAAAKEAIEVIERSRRDREIRSISDLETD